MNTNKVFKQLLVCNKRQFSSSLYNYTSNTNPHVYLTVSKDGKKLGDLVFQLYANHAPQTAENFLSFATGSNPDKQTYEGTTLNGGYPGLLIQGGKLSECNLAADGRRLFDENTTLRHYKRGLLTTKNDGENANGSEFIITLDNTDFLDGYNVIFGELVEGEDVLTEVEKSLSREGHFKNEIKIESSGTR